MPIIAKYTVYNNTIYLVYIHVAVFEVVVFFLPVKDLESDRVEGSPVKHKILAGYSLLHFLATGIENCIKN